MICTFLQIKGKIPSLSTRITNNVTSGLYLLSEAYMYAWLASRTTKKNGSKYKTQLHQLELHGRDGRLSTKKYINDRSRDI